MSDLVSCLLQLFINLFQVDIKLVFISDQGVLVLLELMNGFFEASSIYLGLGHSLLHSALLLGNPGKLLALLVDLTFFLLNLGGTLAQLLAVFSELTI